MIKVKHPTFTLIMPSDKRKITFRPFTVKEEKILLMAQGENTEQALEALKQVTTNCVLDKGFKVDSLPMFDLEYLWINIRAKSVNNILELKIQDPATQKPYDVEIDIDDIKIVFDPSHNKKVFLEDNMGVVMRYPTLKMVQELANENETEFNHAIISQCIAQVFEGDAVEVAGEDFSLDDAKDFLDSLTSEMFDKIKHFFETIPVMTYTGKYADGKEFTLKGWQDFFQ